MKINVLNKKQLITIISLLLTFLLFACNNNNSSKINFIEKDGKKQYQKEDGNIAIAEWVTINDNDYYFDMNGYLETNKWIDNEYYVDQTGKKLIDSWMVDTDGKKYYLSSVSGTYVRDTTMKINDKYYHFNKDGSLLTNQFFNDFNNVLKYSDSNGVIAMDKLFDADGHTYYAYDMGTICTNEWKEINNNWYYFGKSGEMQKNKWIDATYYCGIDGKMLKNGKSPEGYEVDNNGKVLEQYKMLIIVNDFQYIYDTYCEEPWAEIGSDDSYISIDTNPYDSKSEWGQQLYFSKAYNATETLLKLFNFPEYVSKQLGKTSALDGKQTESNEYVTVTWSYRPSEGAEIMFMKKPK